MILAPVSSFLKVENTAKSGIMSEIGKKQDKLYRLEQDTDHECDSGNLCKSPADDRPQIRPLQFAQRSWRLLQVS